MGIDRVLKAVAVLTLIGGGSMELNAQEPARPQAEQAPPETSPAPATDPATSNAVTQPRPASGPHSAEWKGLSVQEKLKYDWIHLFDIDNMFFAAVGAAIDQGRDKPTEWGQGWGAYGERFGSHIGYYVVQRSIMFPVQAIDHEDTRYFPSKRPSYQGRAADAALHTIWRHNDKGGMMPAYSEFLGDYGAAAISRQWWPGRYRTAGQIMVAGTNTLLIDAGINVLHEFEPDIRRWLHLSHK